MRNGDVIPDTRLAFRLTGINVFDKAFYFWNIAIVQQLIRQIIQRVVLRFGGHISFDDI